jgi:thiamine-monophosphate kinase
MSQPPPARGERALIEAIRRLAGTPGGPVRVAIGDDAAVLDLPHREGLIITTDALLDGVHFDTRAHALELIGRKSLACSLSDVAAMACLPIAAVVAVALPDDMSLDDAQRIHTGIKKLADEFGCALIGGDVTSWPHPLAITVTVLGQSPPGRPPVLRSGARIGDRIYLTGPVGGSLLGRHMTFTPRIELADRLAQSAELHAMIDVSDGVATDLQHVCDESHVGAEIDKSAFEKMIHPDAIDASKQSGRPPLDHALQDGEDFELLIATSHQLEALPGCEQVRAIGRITKTGLCLVQPDGTRTPLEPRGYEHFV